ncbi:MAG: hypothetical protein R3F20_12010 [Planctomycetota bacterium]
MLGGTQFNAALFGPTKPVARTQPATPASSDGDRPTLPSEVLAFGRRDPARAANAARDVREDRAREAREREAARRPKTPPRVAFRELGSDDEGGPLVDVEGIPEAVRTHPLSLVPELPLPPKVSIYEADGSIPEEAPPTGRYLDRLV